MAPMDLLQTEHIILQKEFSQVRALASPFFLVAMQKGLRVPVTAFVVAFVRFGGEKSVVGVRGGGGGTDVLDVTSPLVVVGCEVVVVVVL